MRGARLLLPALALLGLGACAPTRDLVDRIPGIGGERVTDEARIAAVLHDVQDGMERGRVFKVLSHVSTAYQDQAGRDYAAIREYLAQVFRTYRDIRITRVGSRITVHGDRAQVVETFGTVATPFSRADAAPLNLQGQLTVHLRRESEGWKIVEWSPLQ